MPSESIVCHTCKVYRPIPKERPEALEHILHNTAVVLVYHSFEMWVNPKTSWCSFSTPTPEISSYLHPACSCPDQIKFPEVSDVEDLLAVPCNVHSTPWLAKYEQWHQFQDFERQFI